MVYQRQGAGTVPCVLSNEFTYATLTSSLTTVVLQSWLCVVCQGGGGDGVCCDMFVCLLVCFSFISFRWFVLFCFCPSL